MQMGCKTVNDENNRRNNHKTLEEFARTLEKMKFADYIEYLNDTGE